MSPNAKPVSTAKRTAQTKVVRPKTPAERVAEKYAAPRVGIVGTWRLEGIQSRLRGLGMPDEEVDRIMGEVRASLGVEP